MNYEQEYVRWEREYKSKLGIDRNCSGRPPECEMIIYFDGKPIAKFTHSYLTYTYSFANYKGVITSGTNMSIKQVMRVLKSQVKFDDRRQNGNHRRSRLNSRSKASNTKRNKSRQAANDKGARNAARVEHTACSCDSILHDV